MSTPEVEETAEQWLARCEEMEAARRVARQERMEAYRPAAEKEWVARVARYYGEDPTVYEEKDMPDYKQRGSHEWESAVPQIMKEMLDRETPFTPVPPFERADWQGAELLDLAIVSAARGQTAPPFTHGYELATSGMMIKADPRIERRLEHVVSDATKRHDMHVQHAHPWCVECHVRECRSSIDDTDLWKAGETDAELRKEGRVRTEERARRWLLAERRIPEHPLTLDIEERRISWLGEEDLADLPTPTWLVDGLLPTSGIGYIIGRDGVKKTFLAIDLVMSVITGTEFHGRQINEEAYTGALFVAGEGVNAFAQRVAAWREARGVPHNAAEQAPASFWPAGVNLFTGDAGYQELLAKAKHETPDLIVLDTLQRCAVGADQNNVIDMGVVSQRLLELKHASGGMILVIAHTDKGDNDARGSSSIEDDADFVMHVKDKDGVIEARVTKQKDGSTGGSIALVAEAHAGSIALVDAGSPAGRDALMAGPLLGGLEARIHVALDKGRGETFDGPKLHRAVNTKDAPVSQGRVENVAREMFAKGEILRRPEGNKGKFVYYKEWKGDAAGEDA